MDSLMSYLADLSDLQDEPIDPELQGAVNQNNSPVRNTKPSKTANNDKKYKVLSSDEIVQYVVDFVQEVNSIIQLKSTVTRMLLHYCKWDKILLMEKFYNDPEKLFKEAHVINPFNVSVTDANADSETNECKICYADLSSIPTATNACGHQFCTACWSEYLKVKIMDEGVGNSISCASTDCDVIIDDETVLELVEDSEAKLRYQHLITNSFVQQNLLLRWCPAPGCSYAIKVDFSPLKPMSCSCKCGHEFCFDCGDVWHEPVPCDLLKRFNGHVKEGLFNPVYYASLRNPHFDRIKTCPNPYCKISIQKIFGCHVMQCKNCSTIFCWDCMNRYKTKASVYQHYCRGEKKSEDTPNATETTGKNDNDDKELAPPQKYVKLSVDEPGVSTSSQSGTQPSSSKSTRREEDTFKYRERRQKTGMLYLGKADKKAMKEEKGIMHIMNDEINGLASYSVKAPVDPPPIPLILNRPNTRAFAAQLNGYEGFVDDDDMYDDNEEAFDRIERRMMGLRRRVGPVRFEAMQKGYPVPKKTNPYYDKYVAEDANLKSVTATCNQIKESMQCGGDKTTNLVQFELASIFLAQCRQLLKYSAIFALYLRQVDAAFLFKNLYQDLEVATNAFGNAISGVQVETPDTHPQITESVIPAHRNCQLRRRALLDYIDEGYDNEWWFFEDQPSA